MIRTPSTFFPFSSLTSPFIPTLATIACKLVPASSEPSPSFTFDWSFIRERISFPCSKPFRFEEVNCCSSLFVEGKIIIPGYFSFKVSCSNKKFESIIAILVEVLPTFSKFFTSLGVFGIFIFFSSSFLFVSSFLILSLIIELLRSGLIGRFDGLEPPPPPPPQPTKIIAVREIATKFIFKFFFFTCPFPF